MKRNETIFNVSRNTNNTKSTFHTLTKNQNKFYFDLLLEMLSDFDLDFF
jgi:hypothetical protein